MTSPWPTKPLGTIADIRVSNVDKKIDPSEVAVTLCNYMDVYANTYVTGDLDFMTGSSRDRIISGCSSLRERHHPSGSIRTGSE